MPRTLTPTSARVRDVEPGSAIDVDLTGRRIVVVGASSGIGRSVAIECATAGARVVAVARRRDQLEALAADHRSIEVVAADARRPDGCRRLADAARSALGQLDAVVLALGASPLVRLRETSPSTWEDALSTNATAPAMVTQSVLDDLAPGSVVAFVSSESVGRPRQGLVPYGAGKAALEEVVRGWRVEHPERRFLLAVVGATMGTDFPRDFRDEAFAEHWNALGGSRGAGRAGDGRGVGGSGAHRGAGGRPGPPRRRSHRREARAPRSPAAPRRVSPPVATGNRNRSAALAQRMASASSGGRSARAASARVAVVGQVESACG